MTTPRSRDAVLRRLERFRRGRQIDIQRALREGAVTRADLQRAGLTEEARRRQRTRQQREPDRETPEETFERVQAEAAPEPETAPAPTPAQQQPSQARPALSRLQDAGVVAVDGNQLTVADLGAALEAGHREDLLAVGFTAHQLESEAQVAPQGTPEMQALDRLQQAGIVEVAGDRIQVEDVEAALEAGHREDLLAVGFTPDQLAPVQQQLQEARERESFADQVQQFRRDFPTGWSLSRAAGGIRQAVAQGWDPDAPHNERLSARRGADAMDDWMTGVTVARDNIRHDIRNARQTIRVAQERINRGIDTQVNRDLLERGQRELQEARQRLQEFQQVAPEIRTFFESVRQDQIAQLGGRPTAAPITDIEASIQAGTSPLVQEGLAEFTPEGQIRVNVGEAARQGHRAELEELGFTSREITEAEGITTAMGIGPAATPEDVPGPTDASRNVALARLERAGLASVEDGRVQVSVREAALRGFGDELNAAGITTTTGAIGPLGAEEDIPRREAGRQEALGRLQDAGVVDAEDGRLVFTMDPAAAIARGHRGDLETALGPENVDAVLEESRQRQAQARRVERVAGESAFLDPRVEDPTLRVQRRPAEGVGPETPAEDTLEGVAPAPRGPEFADRVQQEAQTLGAFRELGEAGFLADEGIDVSPAVEAGMVDTLRQVGVSGSDIQRARQQLRGPSGLVEAPSPVEESGLLVGVTRAREAQVAQPAQATVGTARVISDPRFSRAVQLSGPLTRQVVEGQEALSEALEPPAAVSGQLFVEHITTGGRAAFQEGTITNRVLTGADPVETVRLAQERQAALPTPVALASQSPFFVGLGGAPTAIRGAAVGGGRLAAGAGRVAARTGRRLVPPAEAAALTQEQRFLQFRTLARSIQQMPPQEQIRILSGLPAEERAALEAAMRATPRGTGAPQIPARATATPFRRAPAPAVAPARLRFIQGLPTREQVRFMRALSPAERQAIVRELPMPERTRLLEAMPPAEREILQRGRVSPLIEAEPRPTQTFRPGRPDRPDPRNLPAQQDVAAIGTVPLEGGGGLTPGGLFLPFAGVSAPPAPPAEPETPAVPDTFDPFNPATWPPLEPREPEREFPRQVPRVSPDPGPRQLPGESPFPTIPFRDRPLEVQQPDPRFAPGAPPSPFQEPVTVSPFPQPTAAETPAVELQPGAITGPETVAAPQVEPGTGPGQPIPAPGVAPAQPAPLPGTQVQPALDGLQALQQRRQGSTLTAAETATASQTIARLFTSPLTATQQAQLTQVANALQPAPGVATSPVTSTTQALQTAPETALRTRATAAEPTATGRPGARLPRSITTTKPGTARGPGAGIGTTGGQGRTRRLPLPGDDSSSRAVPEGQHPRVVGINTGATDLLVDLQTGKRQWVKDSPLIPERAQPGGFAVLSTSRVPGGAMLFDLGAFRVAVTGQGINYTKAQPFPRRNRSRQGIRPRRRL